MNLRRIASLLALTLLPFAAAARPFVPAGLGGFVWRSANPTSNDLRAVAAPPPGSDGKGLAAVGDGSTFLFRGAPGAWLGGRQRAVRNDVSYRDVSVARNPTRVAVAADDGTVLIGDSGVLAAKHLSKSPITAVGWATSPQGARTLAIGGAGGAAFAYDDAGGGFEPAKLDGQLPVPPDFQAISFAPAAGGLKDPGPIGFAAATLPLATGPRGALLRTPDAGRTWLWSPEAPAVDAWWDVYAVSADVVYAVGTAGGAGVVAVTQNGGASWQAAAQVDPSMRSIAAFPDGHLLVAGAAGLFGAREGAQFSPRPEPVANLLSPIPIHALDAAGPEAWAVGQAGVIFFSRDEGDTWTAFNDGAPLDRRVLETYHSIEYLSDKEILVAGTGGAVLRSTDAGATFAPMDTPTTEALNALGAAGQRNAGIGASAPPGLAVGARRTVLAADAAGGSWVLRGAVPKADYRAAALADAPAGIQAWAVGTGGTIVHSGAGSPVWDVQDSGVSSALNAVQAVPDGNGGFSVVAAGDGGVVLRSADGSKWGPITPGAPAPLPTPFAGTNLHGVFFRGAALGFVVGDGGVVGRTVDAGREWSARPIDQAGAALLAVSGLPPGAPSAEVYIAGEHQAVYRSVDTGVDWQRLPPPLPNGPDITFRAVQNPAPGVAYVGGDAGSLFLWRDGAWKDLRRDAADTVVALRMATATAGMAVVQSAKTGPRVLFTADGFGSTVEAALPAGAAALAGGDALGHDAVAAGPSGTLLRCFDAASAAPSFSDEASDIRAIASPVPGAYVAAGDAGLLMLSEDGGLSWQRLPSPVGGGANLRALAFAVPDTTGNAVGYAAGSRPGAAGPVLLRTEDSGRTWKDASPDLGADAQGFTALAAFSGVLLAAGDKGAVFLFDGSKWIAQRPISGFDGAWLALSATDARWYVAGERGAIARYPDAQGRPQWQTLYPGTPSPLFGICGPPPPSVGLPGAGAGGSGRSLRDDIRGVCLDPGGIFTTDTGGDPVWGDVNRDAAVNGADAALVTIAAGGLSAATPVVYWYGDIDPPAPSPDALPGDGTLAIPDIARILRSQ